MRHKHFSILTQSSFFIHHPLYHAIIWHLMPFYVRVRKNIYSREKELLIHFICILMVSSCLFFWIAEYSASSLLYIHFISFHLYIFCGYLLNIFVIHADLQKSFSFNEMFLFYDDYDIQPLVLIAKKMCFDSSESWLLRFCSFEKQI